MADIWGTLDMDNEEYPSWLEARTPPYWLPRAANRGLKGPDLSGYPATAEQYVTNMSPGIRRGSYDATFNADAYSRMSGPASDIRAPNPYFTDMPGEASPPSAQQFMGVQSATPQATPSPPSAQQFMGVQSATPQATPSLDTLLNASGFSLPPLPASGANAVPGVPQPQAPLSIPPQGAAQQFMGVAGQGKDQSRMAMYGGPQPGVKGDPWQSPGGASQPPQGGGGAPSGGGAPQQQGPVTMQGVMQSLAQSNPDMMKTREGRITLGMAALKFAPLMHQQDQMEMQRMKMELANQIQMLKLSQGEANLGIQQQRAEAYEAKMKSGADPSKSLENAIKERDTVANHLAQQPNSKELRRSYNEVQKRVDELNKKVNPQGAAKEYSSWLEEAAGSSNPVEKALTSVPQDVISKLRPEEQRQLGEMLITEPIKAHMRIMRLREKMRGGETTVGKSDGNY